MIVFGIDLIGCVGLHKILLFSPLEQCSLTYDIGIDRTTESAGLYKISKLKRASEIGASFGFYLGRVLILKSRLCPSGPIYPLIL